MPDAIVSPGDGIGMRCHVRWELRRADGSLKVAGEAHNLVTQVGDQAYAERAAGVASPPGAATGMKLGTGSTAPSKTGAGAALVTYLSGSQQAFASTYPQSALNGSGRRITYQCVWAAGTATSAGAAITEAVIVNNASLTDATSTAANTLHRVLITGVPSKQAGEALTITWTADLQGV